MKNKVFRPGYRIMHVILNQCLRPNLGKAMFAVVFYNLLEKLLYFVSMIPAMIFMTSSGADVFSMVFESLLSAVLILVATVVLFFLKYGLNVTLCRMVEKSYVTLGYLFIGFRQNYKKVLKGALLFTLIYALIVIPVSVCAGLGSIKFSVEELSLDNFENLLAYAGKFYMIILVLMVVVNLLFSFVWLIIYTEDDCGVFEAFGRSIKYLWGRFFHYIGFMIYAAGLNIVFLVAFSVFSAFIPAARGNGSVPLFSSILTFASIFLTFNIAARVGMARPLYYFFITNKIRVHKSEYRPENKIVPDENANAGCNVIALSADDAEVTDDSISENNSPPPENENQEEKKDNEGE